MTLTRTEKLAVFIGVILGLAAVLLLSLALTLAWRHYAGQPISDAETPVTLIASGTIRIAPRVVASGSCVDPPYSQKVSGVSSLDSLVSAFAADPSTAVGYEKSPYGSLTIIGYPIDGAVVFKVCNETVQNIAPDPIELNWRAVGARPQ